MKNSKLKLFIIFIFTAVTVLMVILMFNLKYNYQKQEEINFKLKNSSTKNISNDCSNATQNRPDNSLKTLQSHSNIQTECSIQSTFSNTANEPKLDQTTQLDNKENLLKSKQLQDRFKEKILNFKNSFIFKDKLNSASQIHNPNELLSNTIQNFSDLTDFIYQNPQFKNEALVEFNQCYSNKEIIKSLRSVCYSRAQKLKSELSSNKNMTSDLKGKR